MTERKWRRMSGWAGALVGLLALVAIDAVAGQASVQNSFIRLGVDGVRVSDLRVDASGSGHFSRRSFMKSLKPEFWEWGSGTSVQVSGSSVTISRVAIWESYSQASSGRTDDPVLLEPGHTLSQKFSVPLVVEFASVTVKLPTWQSKTSGATLSLYRGAELVAQRRMKNVEDNSWQPLLLAVPQTGGDYEIRLSEPSGKIGWWSGPEPGDRAFTVSGRRPVGQGTLTYTLDGSTLRVRAEVPAKPEVELTTLPWRWRTTWKQSGYDCTAKSGVLFSRFFTDTQRYMPVQQLKRRANAGLSFDGCKWIEMDGTADADLLLESSRLHLHWEMQPSEMSLRVDSQFVLDGSTHTSELSITVKERGDEVPDIFPRFTCSDKSIEDDLNRFWWERGLSYHVPVNRSVEWAEWMAMMRTWFGGGYRSADMKMLANYPITDEGYVHTWGNTVGWPLVHGRDTRHFDTNARFILACWRHYLWSGDIEFLKGQAERLRRAMKYQLEVLHGSDGLIVTPEIKTGRHEDLTNNYWDILPFGHLDAYANAVFYGSITAMEQIEAALGADRLTDYPALRGKVHRRYDETFWDDGKGRYVGCVDIGGVKHDYGFTFVNLEALFYGLGDSARAARIYNWMETGKSSTGKADIYGKWIFAPRATTIHNPQWGANAPASEKDGEVKPWWTFWWHGTPYGDQCQDGGAILYTSFFDLMDRARLKSPDDAWRRFGEILERYRMPDRLCGGAPLYLGENPQQESAGSVGLDLPFPESGLAPCYYLYGVIGVEATPDGLKITPSLPRSLQYAGVRGLDWRGARVNVTVTASSVHIDGTDSDGKPFEVSRRIRPGGSFVFAPLVAGTRPPK